jgi:hypothetical protein
MNFCILINSLCIKIIRSFNVSIFSLSVCNSYVIICKALFILGGFIDKLDASLDEVLFTIIAKPSPSCSISSGNLKQWSYRLNKYRDNFYLIDDDIHTV